MSFVTSLAPLFIIPAGWGAGGAVKGNYHKTRCTMYGECICHRALDKRAYLVIIRDNFC